jgi:pyridinium-3,5-bisthiocarboxylic acid mononucleotide nickel chelatase
MAFYLSLRRPQLCSFRVCQLLTMVFQASASRQQAQPSLPISSTPLQSRTRGFSGCPAGFGGRTLSGVSNCLRVLALEEAAPVARSTTAGSIDRRQLAVITFEVDDQSPEDLAVGLDHIRAMHEVFDVTQTSVVGKKGRMAAHVQILVSPREIDSVIVACFEETTTIGLRHQLTEGAILRRRFETIETEGGDKLQVKVVERPGGMRSGKAEAADVASRRGHLKRARLRGEAVALALALRSESD